MKRITKKIQEKDVHPIWVIVVALLVSMAIPALLLLAYMSFMSGGWD